MTGTFTPPKKSSPVRQQSMYELGSDVVESFERPARSGKRRQRGSRGGSHGRKTSPEAIANAILATSPQDWNAAEMDALVFRIALSKASPEFQSFVCASLQAGTLTNGHLQVLIEMGPWGEDEIGLLLKKHILEHPTDASHICGRFIESKTITIDEHYTITTRKPTLHHYEAEVVVGDSMQPIQLSSSGPSNRVARTRAYQQLLIKMCGFDGEDVSPVSAPAPWLDLVASAGGKMPKATVLEEDEPHKHGFTAVATFKIGNREWHRTGPAAPWQKMARQLALNALYEDVLTDLSNDGTLYCEIDIV